MLNGIQWGSHQWPFALLFKALIRSLLEYGCIVWSPHYEVNANILERVQKNFLRCFQYRFPGASLDFPSLADRRLTADSIFFCKLFDGNIDCSTLLGLIGLDCHRRLRSGKTFYVKHCLTNYAFHAPLNRMMRNFNA